MTVLGVLFLLVVLGETLARDQPGTRAVLLVLGWLLWAAFVAEFLIRMTIAPSATRFLRRNWWQIIFLVVPFLRFIRLLQTIRLARAGRVVGSSLRAGRTTGRTLTGRVAWLASVTGVVILGSSQLLYELADIRDYGQALYATAVASIAGEPLQTTSFVGRVLGVGLVVYSVVVFATLAGMLGAFFYEQIAPPRHGGASEQNAGSHREDGDGRR